MSERTVWKDIPGYPGYQASSTGFIRSFKRRGRSLLLHKQGRPRLLKQIKNPFGYYRVGMMREDGLQGGMVVHRAVMFAFHGPVGSEVLVRHLDGDKTNNRLDNLAYGDETDNARDLREARLRDGTAHISDDTVREIREKAAKMGHGRIKALAAEYNLAFGTVSNIVNQKTYRNTGGGPLVRRGRPPVWPPRLHQHRNRARCYFRGVWHDMGEWDEAAGAPSQQAKAEHARALALWSLDPSVVNPKDGELLYELWCDWRESAAAPADPNGEVTTCGRHLFGTAADPGPHRTTLADEFGPPELAAFQLHLCRLAWADGAKAGQPRYGRDMVRRQIRYVWRCFQWGVEAGRVRYEQYAALRLVAPPRRGQVREPVRVRAVLWEVVERTLPHVAPPARPPLLVLWHTGARPEEVCGLTCGGVATGGVIQAQSGVPIDLGAMKVWAAVVPHKSERFGTDRVLFFGPRCRKVLAPLLRGRGPADPLFPTARGSAYSHRGLHQAVERGCAAGGVPHWFPRQVRHSFAVRCQAAFGYDAVRAAIGHRGRGVTAIYSGEDLVTAAKVAAAIG